MKEDSKDKGGVFGGEFGISGVEKNFKNKGGVFRGAGGTSERERGRGRGLIDY